MPAIITGLPVPVISLQGAFNAAAIVTFLLHLISDSEAPASSVPPALAAAENATAPVSRRLSRELSGTAADCGSRGHGRIVLAVGMVLLFLSLREGMKMTKQQESATAALS